MSEHIRAERHGDWGVITLDRPKALNSLTLDMCDAMDRQLKDWAADDAVKAVLVEGEGEKAFCAGGDIRWLTETGRDDPVAAAKFFRAEYRLDTRIHHYPKPYVALMDGITMGGGVGISANAPFRVATDRTVWAMPECAIGLVPDVGSSFFLKKLRGGLGPWLALTGERLRSTDCVTTEIATHHVPSSDLPPIREKMLGLDLGSDPHRTVKHYLNSHESPAPGAIAQALGEIDHYFAGGDDIEALIQSLKTESGAFGQKCLTSIEAASPTSLKLTCRLLAGAPDSFDDCITREFCVAAHLMGAHDFHEGVRAQVIDKDRSPRWEPASLDAVTARDLDGYFRQPPGGPLDLSGI